MKQLATLLLLTCSYLGISQTNFVPGDWTSSLSGYWNFENSANLVQAQVGAGGAKARVGIGTADSKLVPEFGFALAATFVRSWGAASNLPRDQNYLGAEVAATLFHVRINAGVLQRVSGTQGAPTRFLAGAGVGF